MLGFAQPRAGSKQIAVDQPLGKPVTRLELVLLRALELPAGVGEGLNQPQIALGRRAIARLGLGPWG